MDLESFDGVSEKLAILNWERIQNWQPSFNANIAREAVFSFKEILMLVWMLKH